MKISINLEKAKEIKKDHIRQERSPLLASLDVEFIRAVEQGDSAKQQEISAKKQALRDATSHEDLLNAQSIEDLKAFKLENL
jgi:hypothetical protein